MFPSLYGVVSQGGAADWWAVTGKTCVAAYQPIGAASLAASYTNLANPGTNNAAPGTAPTWASATGWMFNGSTQYLISVTVGAAYTSIIRFAAATANKVLYGVSGSTTRHYFQTSNGQGTYLYGTSSAPLGANTFLSGVVALAANTGYQNGSAVGTVAGTFTGTSIPIYIGALNNGNSPTAHNACTVQAVAIYSDTLSGTEVAAVSAAMAALT